MDETGHGVFHWNELITADVEKAKAFYAAILGWTYEPSPESDGPSSVIAFSDDEPVGGIMTMPPNVQTDLQSFWLTYVEVDDVDAALAAVEANGGRVLRPAMDIPNEGRIGMIQDPTGAIIGVVKPIYEYVDDEDEDEDDEDDDADGVGENSDPNNGNTYERDPHA